MSYSLTEIPGSFAGKHPLAADAVIEIGGLVALNAAGNAVPAAAAVTGHVIGRAEESADNTDGDAGDVSVLVRRGIFGCANSATDPVDITHVGKMVFAETPDIIEDAGTCRAGLLLGFDADSRPIIDTRLSTMQTAADVAAAIDAIP